MTACDELADTHAVVTEYRVPDADITLRRTYTTKGAGRYETLAYRVAAPAEYYLPGACISEDNDQLLEVGMTPVTRA